MEHCALCGLRSKSVIETFNLNFWKNIRNLSQLKLSTKNNKFHPLNQRKNLRNFPKLSNRNVLKKLKIVKRVTQVLLQARRSLVNLRTIRFTLFLLLNCISLMLQVNTKSLKLRLSGLMSNQITNS